MTRRLSFLTFLLLSLAVKAQESVLEKGTPGHFLIEEWTPFRFAQISALEQAIGNQKPPTTRNTHPATGLPQIASHTGIRLRGVLAAPASGTYHFWLSTKDSAELFLSNDATPFYQKRLIQYGPRFGTLSGIFSKDRKRWDRFAAQMSRPVQLQAGQKYYLEIRHQNAAKKSSHLHLAWATPGQERQEIPASAITSWTPHPDDQDDNCLPDSWQKKHQLQGHAHSDPDFDGLTNLEEFQNQTDPNSPDTDKDGRSDAQEIRAYHSSPLKKDPPWHHSPAKLLQSFTGNEHDEVFWHRENDILIPEEFRGRKTQHFTAPHEGSYHLEFSLRLLGDLFPQEQVSVSVKHLDRLIHRQSLTFGQNHEALLFIKRLHLTAATHRFTLHFDNFEPRRRVAITRLRIIPSSYVPPSTTTDFPTTSPTSPVFLEGHAKQSPSLNEQAVSTGSSLHHWITNLPLQANSPTPYRLRIPGHPLQNGNITWTPTNILTQKNITIRKGDSLKLTAHPSSGPTSQAVTLHIPTPENLARHPAVKVTASSNRYHVDLRRLVDGRISQRGAQDTSAETDLQGKEAWFELDLGRDCLINRVTLRNFTLPFYHRLAGYQISALDQDRQELARQSFHLGDTHSAASETWQLDRLVTARFIRIQRIRPNQKGHFYLCLSEIEVFGAKAIQLPSDQQFHLHQFNTPGLQKITALHPTGEPALLQVTVKQADFEESPTHLFSLFVSQLTFDQKKITPALTLDPGPHLTLHRQGKNLLLTPHSTQANGPQNLLARLHPGGPVVGIKKLNFIGSSSAQQSPPGPIKPNLNFPNHHLRHLPLILTHLPPKAQITLHHENAHTTFTNGSFQKTIQATHFLQGLSYFPILTPKDKPQSIHYLLEIQDQNGRRIGSK